MEKRAIFTAMAAGLALARLVAGGTALAQAQPRPAGAPPTTERLVTIGCVSRTTAKPEQFLVTDRRGEEPVSYQLDGDAEQLRVHVGHLVEVVGSAAPAPAGSASSAKTVVKVERLVYISKTCDRPK